jgi:hypothetical protein
VDVLCSVQNCDEMHLDGVGYLAFTLADEIMMIIMTNEKSCLASMETLR